MRSTLRNAALLAATLAWTASVAGATATRHLRLVRSEPAADTTVTAAPTEIRLFFSEAPVMTGTTIRLVDAKDNAVEMAPAAQDNADKKIVYAAIKGTVQPGDYTVNWRTSARDGHVVRGEFTFSYHPPAAKAR